MTQRELIAQELARMMESGKIADLDVDSWAAELGISPKTICSYFYEQFRRNLRKVIEAERAKIAAAAMKKKKSTDIVLPPATARKMLQCAVLWCRSGEYRHLKKMAAIFDKSGHS